MSIDFKNLKIWESIIFFSSSVLFLSAICIGFVDLNTKNTIRQKRPLPNAVQLTTSTSDGSDDVPDHVINVQLDKACNGQDTSNAEQIGCAYNYLVQAAVEREWKQRKLEAATPSQITVQGAVDRRDEQKKIHNWRINFVKMRDTWCDGVIIFSYGSGTPFLDAECRLKLELLAIKDLNDLYCKDCYNRTIMGPDVAEGTGIPDFEPTASDIDALIKNNPLNWCVWSGEKECNVDNDIKNNVQYYKNW